MPELSSSPPGPDGRNRRPADLGHRSDIHLADGSQLDAVGNFLEKEFEIRSGGMVVAQVSRSWFQLRDTYAADVPQGTDAALMIAIAVSLDRIEHDQERSR